MAMVPHGAIQLTLLRDGRTVRLKLRQNSSSSLMPVGMPGAPVGCLLWGTFRPKRFIINAPAKCLDKMVIATSTSQIPNPSEMQWHAVGR